MRNPTRPPHRPANWRRGMATLPPGIWPDSTVHTGEAAALLGVATRTLERHRRAGTGPVQVPGGTFYGRTVRYITWQLLAWRNAIIGEGPADRDGIWQAWLETKTDGSGPRPEPPRRPAGTPKGEDRRDTQRRLRRDLILRWAQAEDEHAQRLYETARQQLAP